jgi:uncharacterized protein (DUF924 family)
MHNEQARNIIDFWLAAGPARWFEHDPAFDDAIRARFLSLHDEAVDGAFADWTATAEGSLALLLLLDQFPRNLFRRSARAFATDARALDIARRAIDAGFDKAMEPPLRRFFYLPFMHSEKLADQDRCLALCEDDGDAEGRAFAVVHRDIIAKFGRFPHRNAALGRATTAPEQAFLDAGGFAG